MNRGIFAGMGMTFALGGCILIDTYQSDTYKPQETSSTSSSSASSSTGTAGAGGSAGQGGSASQGGGGGMGGVAGMSGMGGAVEPPGMVEICGNDADEDGVNGVCPQNVATWNARYGDLAMQRIRHVTLSDAGDVLVAGEYDGKIELGSSMNPFIVSDGTPNGSQAFVARFGSDGTPKWILYDGLVNEGHAADILPSETTTDTYWTGQRGDRAQLVKVSSAPAILWTTNAFADAPGSRASAMTFATLGATIYVAGTVTGSGNFTCNAMPNPAYDVGTKPALFLAAIEPGTGNCTWAKIYAGGNIDPESVTLKFFGGSPIIAGTYRTRITGTAWPVVSAGNSGIFFLAANPSTGTIATSRGYATAGAGQINVRRLQAMGTPKGNLFVTGSFKGKFVTNPLIVNPSSTSADSTVDAFVMSVNFANNFEVQWINRFGGKDIQEGTGLAAANGVIHATGITYQPMSPDPATTLGQMCPPDGGKCMYWIQMVGETGKVEWAQAIGSNDGAPNPTIDVALNSDNLVLAGSWSLPIDFGDMMPKADKGDLDIFLASYATANLP